MRTLVTGGAGFIGSTLAAALLSRGERVTVLDDFSTGKASNLDHLSGDLDVVRGDVTRIADLERAMRDVGAVMHHAAVVSVPQTIDDPLRADEVNVHGTLLVLEHARRAGVKKVTFAASAAAYGDAPDLPQHEGLTPRPLSPYAVAKVAGEHYMRVYTALHGMHCVALRYFNIFGPRQDPNGPYAAVVPKFIERALAGVAPSIFGDGQQTRDFCHVDDVVEANFLAMECPAAAGRVINIAGGTELRILDLARVVCRAAGIDEAPKLLPPRVGEVPRSVADVRLARQLLGWQAKVSIEHGIAALITLERARAQARKRP